MWESLSENVRLQMGDCLKVLRSLPDNYVDSIVTDPPYGLGNPDPKYVITALEQWFAGDREHVPNGKGFMGRDWDAFVPPPAVWDECMRVLKPGGHLAVFAGSRTVDLMGLSIRLAGFEMRDGIAAWLYGSGFPKSLDVSKAIDKQRDDKDAVCAVTSWLAGEAEVKGITRAAVDAYMGTSDMGGWWLSRLRHRCALPTPEQWVMLGCLIGFDHTMDDEVWRLNGRKGTLGEAWEQRKVIGQGNRVRRVSSVQIAGLSEGAFDITAPATADARQWQGWGTALKPAHEPIILARKPLVGTVAANVLEHGTGGINVDACRIASDEDTRRNARGGDNGLNGESTFKIRERRAEDQPERDGRWPTNAVFAHHPDCGPDEAPGDCVEGCQVAALDGQSGVTKSTASAGRQTPKQGTDALGDFAGNLEHVAGHSDTGGASRFFPTFRYQAKAPKKERPNVEGVAHPTVKPLGLMRWLVKLVTPPNGVVLDCFAGSGTTGEACQDEGVRCILVESFEDYAPLIRSRFNHNQED